MNRRPAFLMPAGGQLASERDVNAATPLKATSRDGWPTSRGGRMAENCLVRVPLRCFTRIENVGTLQAEAKLHFWPDRVQVRRLRLASVLIYGVYFSCHAFVA